MRTEMPGIEIQGAPQDEAAVAAIRGGDAERYRELVERHERRVFAIAWSRLGDAALAEEVTQEAFIRAYRRLWLLGDGAKFAGWVNTIVRRVAINFGLRHRRELNKRERWALENPQVSTTESSTGEPDPLHTPETLRQTLADLPAAHRECLVLFYIEGKSGAEAAAALGVSEAALRVRLHRARTAMRERLEEKLAGSLSKLRPGKTLVPAVMTGVLAASSAKATAGGTIAVALGAKITTALGKTFLFAWLVPLLSVIASLPSLIAVSFIMRKERQNFRDAEGFRPELHRRFFRNFIWGFPLLLGGFALLNHSLLASWGIKTQQLLLALLVSALTLISARSLMICRNPFQVGMFAYCLIIAVGLFGLALGWIPSGMAQLPILAATLLFLIIFKRRPSRMDYSLFLRAAHGLLKASEVEKDSPPTNRLGRRALLGFARFLGTRFLVNNFRWESGRLLLRLPPVENRFLTNMAAAFMPPISQNCSHIALGWDGTVRAHYGRTDAQNLAALKTSGLTNAEELESLVEESMVQSWQAFRSGNIPAAERALGDAPESEVFVVPPARAQATLWWRILIGASVVLMMVGLMPRLFPSTWMARLDGLKPVSISEEQVRAFLNDTTPNRDPKKFKSNSAYLALLTCLALPPTNLFSPEGLRAMRDEVAENETFNSLRKSERRMQTILRSSVAKRALEVGWIGWGDINLQPREVGEYIHRNQQDNELQFTLELLLTRERAWSWVDNQGWDVERVGHFSLTQLRWLRYVNGLDLVDREKLVVQIASIQVLSAIPAPGQPPIHDWKDVRGLFFTPCWPALQDTYYSLAALEILGGLDKIDREACIRGILSRHAGQGYFTSPNSGGFNEYHIDGSARDTIAAFESLRILGALDRVKDLDQWQFRPQRRGLAKGQLTWQDVEAWVCQRRFENILRQRKENPQMPAGSLLTGTIGFDQR
jgi:RNA polymerase sigma-70 factor (ECF subfamily)